MKILNAFLKIALLVASIVLVYLIIAGIRKPIEFEKQRAERYRATIERLIDIRTAQVAFKAQHGCYTPSFDTLVNFIKTGKMPIVKAIGSAPDSLSEKEALSRGLIRRDTVYLPIIDTLFKHIKYPIEELGYVPVGKKTKFRMDTATIITGSNIAINVFEAKANNWDILDGLDKQYIINFNAEKDSVLKVGSLETANNNAGNWE